MSAADTRRVDLTPLSRLLAEIETGPGSERERMRRFNREMPGTLAGVRRKHYREMGMVPVPINGSMPRGAKAGYFMMRLRDGSLGYLQRRADDCLQSAVASCLQVPMHQVPDLQINQQLDAGKEPEAINRAINQTMARWLDRRGVTATLHAGLLPISGRWIGVVPGPISGDLATDHCLLMVGRDCLMDTANPTGALNPELRYGYRDVAYGLTIE